MPDYVFQHPETGETKNVFFHMNDEKIYIDDKNVKWNRVYSSPFLMSDTRFDPYKKEDYIKVTNKPGTIGDLWDKSGEFSAKRQEKEGIDLIKKEYEDKIERETGIMNVSKRKIQTEEKMKKKRISIKNNILKRMGVRPKE